MKSIAITNARQDLYNLVDETINESEPIQIISKRGNAILMSEQDFNAIQETLYLSANPSIHQSIKDGINESLEDCMEEVDWNIE